MPLDDNGFLDDEIPVHESLENAQPGDLLSLSAATEARALVLLGEPGLGKSTALRSIASDLRARSIRVAWIDGANLADETFASEMGEHLDRAPMDDQSPGGPNRQTLVIDGLDESPMVRRLPRRLREELSGHDLASLQVIIGCRTTDLPADLPDTLEQLFGDDVVFADLGPLKRSDAVVLASSLAAPGEELASTAVALGAGSLAAVPLTLALLVQEFLENGTLDVSARELFERGILTLLDATVGGGVSTVDQRRAVAERIAAVMLLSGKRTIFVGRALDAGRQDLRASDVTGGTERTAGGTFDVTSETIRATLETPLFGGRGADRLAFVHASQAAFLGACYLRRHEPRMPRRQLEGLLLVAAPDASRSIPVPLRELAAWLSSLDPVVGAWLSQIDPASLVGHESYLESDDLRSAVAQALLARAGEFELGDHYWTGGIDLSHRGLAGQVLDVLDEFESQPADWSDFARCRVALRLAQHASSPTLTERLLQIAESTEWNAHLGSLAVEAVLAQDPSATVRLVQLLRALDNPEYARLRDSDDELKGYLLRGLWPKHVALPDVLPSLRPRQSRLFGAYWIFLRNFPDQLDEAQLATTLDWAGARAAEADAPADGGYSDDGLLPEDRPIGAVDGLLAAGLVERALACRDPAPLMATVASLTWPRLERYDHPTLPQPLDEVATGHSTVSIRRSFAEALLRQRAPETQGRLDVWHLLHAWRPADSAFLATTPTRSTLLDGSDFVWAAGRAEALKEASPRLAGLFSDLAGFLFNPFDVEAVEVASQLRDSIVWDQVRNWFDPVELESEEAERLRQQHERTSEGPQPDEVEAARTFRDDLTQEYAELVAGDWTKFRRVAWLLQFDPTTAAGRRTFDDRLLTFPALTALAPDAPTQLRGSAREFLLHENDHAEEWLGTETYDRRAWAGYLALVLLDEVGELDSIPLECIASWAGAIIWFWSVPHETGDPARKRRLIRRSVEADAARVAALLVRYVRGELRRGSSASEVEAFDATSVRALQETWVELVKELHTSLLATDDASSAGGVEHLSGFSSDDARSTANYAWQRMFRCLASSDPTVAENLATSWARAVDSANARDLSATAVTVLLEVNASAWRQLDPILRADDELGRSVAASIASGHGDVGLLAALDETELGDLYQWLAKVYPPDSDPPEQTGVSWATREAQARRWRDSVLTAIANRGADESVRVLSRLHDRFPSRIVVLSNLIRARITAFATAWVPPTPAEVQALLEDARRRLVRSAGELALLIREALEAIETDFIHTGQLLWDRLPKVSDGTRPWVPKPEAALSAFLAHDLRLRLHDRGVAVHREVLVKPTDPYGAGDRPDILVEAFARDQAVTSTSVHRVAIEVKGSWNRDVLTAQHDQLARRYLPEAGTGTGLYVVGWYPTELWHESDYRRSQVRTPTSDELLRTLSAQAEVINRSEGLLVASVVLVVPRPDAVWRATTTRRQDS